MKNFPGYYYTFTYIHITRYRKEILLTGSWYHYLGGWSACAWDGYGGINGKCQFPPLSESNHDFNLLCR